MRRLFTVWFAWLVLMAGANLATPLYAVYAERFHFSPLVLTAIFATYAIVLVPALILFGRLSDRFGRRPVVAGGLATACVGLALFAAAEGTAWLFAARAVQGLAVGMISGAATAALVELDPHGSRRRAALGAGLAQAGGSALGPLVAGVLAVWALDPTRLCYLVTLACTLVAAAFVLRLPERREGAPEPWRPQWPRVPAEIRRPFLRVGLTAGVVWAVMALFLSIVPSYTELLLSTKNLAVVGAIAALGLLASFVAQSVLERLAGSHRRDQALGCVLLALGLGGVVAAAPAGSIALLIGGSIVAGIGHGIAFLTAQQELNERAPDERRGEVTAAFIACIYFLVASFVIASGLLGSVFSLDSSVEAVGSVLIVLALGVAPGTPLLGALPLPGIEQLLHVPSLLVAELEAREEAPGLGHVVVLDRGLEVLPGRDRLPQLAPQPAEEAYLRGFHAASVAALAGRYRSAARRTISAACSLESWSVLTTRS